MNVNLLVYSSYYAAELNSELQDGKCSVEGSFMFVALASQNCTKIPHN